MGMLFLNSKLLAAGIHPQTRALKLQPTSYFSHAMQPQICDLHMNTEHAELQVNTVRTSDTTSYEINSFILVEFALCHYAQPQVSPLDKQHIIYS